MVSQVVELPLGTEAAGSPAPAARKASLGAPTLCTYASSEQRKSTHLTRRWCKAGTQRARNRGGWWPLSPCPYLMGLISINDAPLPRRTPRATDSCLLLSAAKDSAPKCTRRRTAGPRGSPD